MISRTKFLEIASTKRKELMKIKNDNNEEEWYIGDDYRLAYDIMLEIIENEKIQSAKKRKKTNPKKRKLTAKQLEYIKDLRNTKKLSRKTIVTLYNAKYKNSQITVSRLRSIEKNGYIEK
jgi:hypothetical protein